MVPIPISTTNGHQPFRYNLSDWDCKNAVIKQIVGQSKEDLHVDIEVVKHTHHGDVVKEKLVFGKQLSPTSFEIFHPIEDCSKTYIEITSTAGSDIKLMLLYE